MAKRNAHHNHVRPRSISRREFIKVAVIVGLVAGCGAVEQLADTPTSKPTDTPVPTTMPPPKPTATPTVTPLPTDTPAPTATSAPAATPIPVEDNNSEEAILEGETSEEIKASAPAATGSEPGPIVCQEAPCRLEIQATETAPFSYLLFLPKGYGHDPDTKWPLILFLHGMGERGDDLELIKTLGIPKITEQQDDFGFIAVSPQCPADTLWPFLTTELKMLLDEVVSAYAVDTSRLYLTGLSMGGYGTWYLAMDYPDQFAAIAPVCGGGDPARACVLKDLPVWTFHGAKDDEVPIEESENMVNALKACGGDVKFTIYPDGKHDVHTPTYDNPELYTWFLEHSKK